MKIATWNVNSIRTRQQIVVDWLQENPVDVLCLQETKVVEKLFPKQPFEDLNYQVYISGQKAYNGVAILSRQSLDVQIGFVPVLGTTEATWDEQKRVICGRIPEENIAIVNLYVPNGAAVGSEKYEYKLGWFEVLGRYLKALRESGVELCVCGDFNVALEDRDIYQPKKENQIMASPAERQTLQDILEAAELRDAFRKFTEEGGHFSWWDYRQAGFARDRGWRIDHHYLTPQLYDRSLGCAIDVVPRSLPKPSDHTPVIVEF